MKLLVFSIVVWSWPVLSLTSATESSQKKQAIDDQQHQLGFLRPVKIAKRSDNDTPHSSIGTPFVSQQHSRLEHLKMKMKMKMQFIVNEDEIYSPTPYPTVTPSPTIDSNDNIPTSSPRPTSGAPSSPTKSASPTANSVISPSPSASMAPTIASVPTLSPVPSVKPTNDTITPSPTMTTSPTPSPSSASQSSKPTSGNQTSSSPTAAPSSQSTTHHHRHGQRLSLLRILGKTLAWMLIIALALLMFGFGMSNRYRIYYYIRSAYYAALRWHGTQWFLHKTGLGRFFFGDEGSGHFNYYAPASNTASSSLLNDVIFEYDYQDGGLVLQDT